MKQVIARIYPLTNTPVIFDVDSKATGNGRLKAFMNGEDIEVGYDFYMHTEHLDPAQAMKLAQAYAKHANIPEHDVLVRQRFPKSAKNPRKLNDANLVLVKKDEAQDKPDDLQQLAQSLHDQETKKSANIKEEQKASVEKPHGATVKRSAEEKTATKTSRRKYEKKPNKRSESAMKRYLDELSKTAAQSETLLQPVIPGPGVSQADIDDATMTLAIKLAKLLQNIT